MTSFSNNDDVKRKGLPPGEEGLPNLLWPSKHVDIVGTLATLLGKIIQVTVTQATRSCTIQDGSQREPDRAIESQRCSISCSLWLSMALFDSLSLFPSLWLTLDLCLAFSGSLWSRHCHLTLHFYCKYVKLCHFVSQIVALR